MVIYRAYELGFAYATAGSVVWRLLGLASKALYVRFEAYTRCWAALAFTGVLLALFSSILNNHYYQHHCILSV